MKNIKYLFIVFICVLLSGCAASRQNPYIKKRKNSHISTSQLGRNKYYFSKDYQRKLKKSYNRKRY